MRKELLAAMTMLAYISFGISGAGAQTAASTPAPTESAPAAVPSPESSPVAEPSAAASALPPRTMNTKADVGDADLSGHIDYTFDANTMRKALKQLGVNATPPHYRPFLQLGFGGVEMISLQDENDSATAITIVVVEDPDEMLAKMRALAHAHLTSVLNPMSAAKAPGAHCTQAPGYAVGLVKVRVVGCSNAGTGRVKTEYASIPNGDIPISIYLTAQSKSPDESGFKALIKAINTDKSMQ